MKKKVYELMTTKTEKSSLACVCMLFRVLLRKSFVISLKALMIYSKSLLILSPFPSFSFSLSLSSS